MPFEVGVTLFLLKAPIDMTVKLVNRRVSINSTPLDFHLASEPRLKPSPKCTQRCADNHNHNHNQQTIKFYQCWGCTWNPYAHMLNHIFTHFVPQIFHRVKPS